MKVHQTFIDILSLLSGVCYKMQAWALYLLAICLSLNFPTSENILLRCKVDFVSWLCSFGFIGGERFSQCVAGMTSDSFGWVRTFCLSGMAMLTL